MTQSNNNSNKTEPPQKSQNTLRPLNFKIKIKNFGPIASGEINLKPLTILIGPNQSGKSYAAMLIYTIIKSKILERNELSFSNLLTEDEEKELEKIIDSIENKELFLDDPKLVDFFISKYKQFMNKKFNNQMAWVFVDKTQELMKYGTKSTHIEIFCDNFEERILIKRTGATISNISELNLKKHKLEDTLNSESYKFNVTFTKTLNNSLKNFLNPETFKKLNFSDEKIKYLPYTVTLDDIFSEQFFIHSINSCFYLPAARSGILQGHNALAASLTFLAPHSGQQKVTIPSLSGIISDFIQKMVFLPHDNKGPLYNLAHNFEKELIYGEIKFIDGKDQFSYPEIKYSFNHRDISLHRSSSTVSELAPIFLSLKYFVRPNSLLIIEEPEAHLHPQNQRILAKLIVHLIRNNVRVLITTHSDFLLQQISNYILMSKLDKNKRTIIDNDKLGYINEDEISINRFEYSEKTGNVIKNVIINENGIPQEEFVKIGNDLYRESEKIQRHIIDITN